MHDSLWQPIKVGGLDLDHRIVMAPMTRNRSTPEGVPNPMNVEYYAQRAGATALIITEGTQPSDDGQGYLLTPGIYTAAQINGWRKVTDAVHDAGGRIFIQLMHVGRVGHPVNTPHGRTPIAPSPVRAAGTIVTYDGPLELPVPREIDTAEIPGVVDDYRRAAAAAMEAGADGVEIHGANGYLIHQFLAPNTNLRTDEYGGSDENKARFALEVAQAVAAEIGAERTGFRIAPGNPFNDIQETDPRSLYLHLVEQLAGLDLAYLHLVRPADDDFVKAIRAAWPNPLIVNHARQPLEPRLDDLANGLADILSLGALHIANPDLAVRLKGGHPLNQPDPDTFYGGDSRGYIDYPALDA
ncbi:alkene reductase [Nocardioides humi]|uniref:Alkene reductase n=1 Tax=Nocardioides humi TaxID=449461 RepID=A0ABN2BTJ6_9ACTN|nr:alkene reductase [Nocardioides humi]